MRGSNDSASCSIGDESDFGTAASSMSGVLARGGWHDALGFDTATAPAGNPLGVAKD